jgi:tRNA A37 threonylcarbamoyladenosine modification protein TsaB
MKSQNKQAGFTNQEIVAIAVAAGPLSYSFNIDFIG